MNRLEAILVMTFTVWIAAIVSVSGAGDVVVEGEEWVVRNW